MCFVLPSRVVEIDGDTALVQDHGRTRRVSLVLLDEPLAVGDHVRLMHGRFAVERLDEAEARQALALIEQALARAGQC